MKLLNMAGALGALAVTLGVAAPASAVTTYYLNLSEAQSGLAIPYGKVDVTEGVNTLGFVVTLNDGLKFTDTGEGHNAFTFSLTGEPVVGFSGPAGFSFTRDANDVQNSPFGLFDYALSCTTVCAPNTGGYAGTLNFSITGAGLTLASLANATTTYNGQTVLFAADTISGQGVTGAIGGGVTTAVPEPATWAMMIVGLGMVGMGLRLRRRPQASIA